MGVFDKFKNMIGIEEDYYDDDYEYEYERKDQKIDTKSERTEEQPAMDRSEKMSSYDRARRSNIVTMQSSSSERVKITVHEPVAFDDGPLILDDIINRRVVVMNLEMLEMDKKRQIFDFVSGGIYSLDGKIQKVTKDIFVIAPKGVEIDGKLKDQIQSKGFYQL